MTTDEKKIELEKTTEVFYPHKLFVSTRQFCR